MTLSTWLRDYLYFPLGGSRAARRRAYFNLWITVFLVGIWHGASWNFVLYGAIHATAMVLHRVVHRATGRKKDAVDPTWLRALKIAAMLQLVVFSRILFRAKTLGGAWEVTRQLFSGTTSMAQITAPIALLLLFGFAWHLTPRKWLDDVLAASVRVPGYAYAILLAAAIAGAVYVASLGSVPYIYVSY
jgi:alginate O-acetyltransferase complex protein AlgI